MQGIVQSRPHIVLYIFRLCNQLYSDNFRAVSQSLASYSGMSSNDVATSTTDCLMVKSISQASYAFQYLPLIVKGMLEVIYCFIAENYCFFILHCRMS